MKSNLKLRSNVYVRLPVSLRQDPQYRSKVRGREALRTLLNRIETYDTTGRAERWLTEFQLKEWYNVARCGDCEEQVFGPVRGDGVQFRCPRGICPHRH
jgi:hypothetical protein